MKLFLKLFKNIKSPYFEVLPYNLNWLLKDSSGLTDKQKKPIVIVDIGCRGEGLKELWPLRKKILYIGFDADAEECKRMEAEKHDFYDRKIYPVFIGLNNGFQNFNLYKSKGVSSMYEPDERYAALYGGPGFKIEKTISLETISMDDFFKRKRDLPNPDMIKIDTQGTELDILRGATQILKSTMMIEVEVEFTSAYKNQPLFDKVMSFMLENGFELIYLNRVFQQKKGYSGYGRGQLTFGDALFSRREDKLGDLNNEKIINHATLLINYGHLDAAYSILKTRELSNDTEAIKLFKYLNNKERYSIFKTKQFITSAIDKILILLLKCKKHNHLNFESDRSWPIR